MRPPRQGIGYPLARDRLSLDKRRDGIVLYLALTMAMQEQQSRYDQKKPDHLHLESA
jgi:hypothetical protein